MAYAAALISLKHNIERLIISESAREAVTTVEGAIKSLDRSTNSSIRSAEIREAAWELEDHVLRCCDSNEALKKAIDSFLEYANYSEDELDNSLGDDEQEESTVDHQCTEISNGLLLQDHSGRKIVSIVGMAGIGKTFLATKIYEKVLNVRHSNVPYFNVTAWVSVGPNPNIENVLVEILAQIQRKPTASYEEQDRHKLALSLHKSLYRRKYFIVLDDVWDTKEMKYLMNHLPEKESNGRLLITTRLEKLPYPTTSTDSLHNMRLLGNGESWNLLWRTVFDGQPFPPQIEKAGRKIAENCEGLPLLVLAVAKILRSLDWTGQECWKNVADMNTTTFQDAYDDISEVLSSSYDYLPEYLKACFLYMGVFPYNSEIPLPKLINLWTVEDFLEPNQSQSLQDFAIKCLEELVSKSLVIICTHSSNYRIQSNKLDLEHTIKSCKLHSAYWSLCVKEARKNGFLRVLSKLTDNTEEYIASQCRISVQNNNILSGIKEVYDSIAAASTTRSLLFTGGDHQYPVPVCFDLMHLKVLDALAIRFYEFPVEVLKLLQLKYLALTHNGNLPSLISELQNLQSLIIRQHHNIKLVAGSNFLPKEIWYMQELRHLRIMGSNLPNPSDDGAELPNLLTLHVKGHSCTEDVFRRTPNLKKLGIKIEVQPRSSEIVSCFEHISILQELESLKCVVVNPRPGSQVVAPPNPSSSFPRGLKKLSLNGLGYSWDYMSLIGSLPKLEVLKLRCFAFQGAEWETEVGEFQRLKFLLLEDIDLVEWTSNDDDCFPRLRRLIIRHCYKLTEIPWQIEESATIIKTIEIVDCGASVVHSAQKILKAKKEIGHDSFEVKITSSLNLPI